MYYVIARGKIDPSTGLYTLIRSRGFRTYWTATGYGIRVYGQRNYTVDYIAQNVA